LSEQETPSDELAKGPGDASQSSSLYDLAYGMRAPLVFSMYIPQKVLAGAISKLCCPRLSSIEVPVGGQDRALLVVGNSVGLEDGELVGLAVGEVY